MIEQTVYICEYCNRRYETKEDALKCEKMGHAINTLKLTLRFLLDDTPYPWIELYNKKTKKNFLVYPKNITFGNIGETTCLHKIINITSYDNVTFKIDKFNCYEFVDTHTLEKIYKKKNILPDASFIDHVLDINISPILDT